MKVSVYVGLLAVDEWPSLPFGSLHTEMETPPSAPSDKLPTSGRDILKGILNLSTR